MSPDEIRDEVGQVKAFLKMAYAQWVVIDYTDEDGVRSERRIVPERIYFGTDERHPEPQWLLEAADEAEKGDRTFAMAGIRSWRPWTPE